MPQYCVYSLMKGPICLKMSAMVVPPNGSSLERLRSKYRVLLKLSIGTIILRKVERGSRDSRLCRPMGCSIDSKKYCMSLMYTSSVRRISCAMGVSHSLKSDVPQLAADRRLDRMPSEDILPSKRLGMASYPFTATLPCTLGEASVELVVALRLPASGVWDTGPSELRLRFRELAGRTLAAFTASFKSALILSTTRTVTLSDSSALFTEATAELL
mmetsp:Transcript_1343/g.3211  ORF Transcript_1343/g.3211 Transcript_1343/m.3211 type:complete len:215 (+) Transcript_1343:840-1484(+)